MMGANTLIEWCHHTVNFWWGCTFATLADGSLSEECRHCYALMLAKLFSREKATWVPDGNRWIRHEAARRELYKLDGNAYRRGVRERVFINSMSDTFENRDDLHEARWHLWLACGFVTNIDILLLTKRPENVLSMVPPSWLQNWPANVWIGTTAGTQKAADERIPALLNIPAAVRFVSAEPLLEPVDLTSVADDGTGCLDVLRGLSFCDGRNEPALTGKRVHWVICGGESGGKARPMNPDWARSLRDQCAAVEVPFFFKQWGEWLPYGQVSPNLPDPHEKDGGEWCSYNDTRKNSVTPYQRWMARRPGKKAAGRLLDGVEHNAIPEVTA